jgi:hypothetical protein
MENWKIIDDCSSYEISDKGNIRNVKTKKIRSINCPSKLYVYINLYTDKNKTKSFRVHRLVAIAFIPNPNNYPCVNHINGDKKDNNVDNLEWCSYSYNTLHAYQTGLIIKNKSFTPDVETAIKILLKNKLCSTKDLAKLLNVSSETIAKLNRT